LQIRLQTGAAFGDPGLASAAFREDEDVTNLELDGALGMEILVLVWREWHD